MKYFTPLSFFFLFLLSSCLKEKNIELTNSPTPYVLTIPSNFPPVEIPDDNPLTVEGVRLGRHLFWENRMSGDNSMSCASCHAPQYAFSDPSPSSIGINGDSSKRNSMVLQNLAWSNDFF